MKAFVSLILLALLIGGVYMVSTGGCKAQAQVAGDQLMEKINKWLGELNVKRQEIANSITDLEKSMENVRQKKISAEVQLEEYKKKVDPIKHQIERIKAGLVVYQPHVAAVESVEINGRTLTPDEIRNDINTLADEYETLNQQLGGYEVSIKAFQQSYDLLARQQASASETMKNLKGKLTEIDAKKEALDGMKTAQTILGESGSISDKFTELESQINDLFVDVETGLRVESEKISERERDLASSTSNVNEILGQLQNADETAARLNAILGTPPGDSDNNQPDQ